MYLNFFGFSEKPFSITPDLRFLYRAPSYESTLSSLLYGIQERRGFMVLEGEVGTGKTTTVRMLLGQLEGTACETALIINPMISNLDLVKTIHKDFGAPPIASDSLHDQLEGLNQFLLKSMKAGRNALVVIDEAQNLSLEALEMTRLFSNLETETQKLLQILLVGQPELENKLKDAKLRQLEQRIQVKCFLNPLSLEETRGYILFRLQRVAGEELCLKFHDSVFKKIHDFTHGVPRLINNLAERMLLAAYLDQTYYIDKKIISRAMDDMNEKRAPQLRERLREGGLYVTSA